MNALDELGRLQSLFSSPEKLIEHAEHVAHGLVPEPYHRLLVHEHHMTVTMENFHGTPVTVQVLHAGFNDDWVYHRKILLRRSDNGRVVQFGLVRFDFSYVTTQVKEEIVAGKTPLGRILINHNVLRHIDLGPVLRIIPGDELREYFQCPAGTQTYGRLATIFCNSKPAVDLLEVSAPVSPVV